jgi:nitroimidazol reductase NimA-like FMN-containing flavoprotein (pyridoxamine 5'-phosphate oxidase superfamily)
MRNDRVCYTQTIDSDLRFHNSPPAAAVHTYGHNNRTISVELASKGKGSTLWKCSVEFGAMHSLDNLSQLKERHMIDFVKTNRNRIKRLPKRGEYDRDRIYRILDEALICHVGFVDQGQPFVIPINFARMGDAIMIHGAKASRLLKHIAAGQPVCVEATIVDGLVLARSVFHHSVNYRSVVLFGTGRLIEDKQEKLAALQAVTEHLIPGRWAEARLPNRKELNATSVVSIKIEEASAKIRVGPPIDDEEDYGLPVWAGLLPLQESPLTPVRDELQSEEIPLPAYIAGYSRTS